MQQLTGKPLSREEAARCWHEEVYLPTVSFIRDAGVLAHLPERTEADLYVWLVRHWDEAVAVGSRVGRMRARSRFRRSFAPSA